MTQGRRTQCPYCGVGCGLEVSGNTPQTARIRGDVDHPSSQGLVCLKGVHLPRSMATDRLETPLMRDSLTATFKPVSWSTALDRLSHEISSAKSHAGPDSIALYGSGQWQSEDYYVAQKFMRIAVGTNNLDTNSRLCMASAVRAYQLSLGSDGPPCSYADMETAKLLVIIGSSIADCHPVLYQRLLRAKRKSGQLWVVIDPRRTAAAQAADLHLQPRLDSDHSLLRGLARSLHEADGWNHGFVAQSTRGVHQLKSGLEAYPKERIIRETGVSGTDFHRLTELWCSSPTVVSLWSMGVNQSSRGTATARAIIDLHLLSGKIGRPGCGPFALTGQPNAMGGRESGGLSSLLPGYRSVDRASDRAAMEALWKVPPGHLPQRPGLTALDMISALEDGRISVFWIAASNPAVSMPDTARVRAALERSPFTVVSECYRETESTALAHLLLPCAGWAEKTGCMTNSERVVTLCPALFSPPGSAQPDWQIFAELGRRLGWPQQFKYARSDEVFSELVAATVGQPCDLTGIDHKNLTDRGPLAWPHAQTTAGHRYAGGRFPTEDGRASISETTYPERPAETVPQTWTLLTGRRRDHWHTLSRTGKIAACRRRDPGPCIDLNPADARALTVVDGDYLELRSATGQVRLPVRCTDSVPQGCLFVPFHWGRCSTTEGASAEANHLIDWTACPQSKQPGLKGCTVEVYKLQGRRRTAA